MNLWKANILHIKLMIDLKKKIIKKDFISSVKKLSILLKTKKIKNIKFYRHHDQYSKNYGKSTKNVHIDFHHEYDHEIVIVISL